MNYEARRARCLVCGLQGEGQVCLHHVKTRGSGGRDEPWNLMPLCQEHHNEVHNMGLTTFADEYSNVTGWLLNHGWEYLTKREKWIKPLK